MEPMRLATIAILLTLLAYTLDVAIITGQRKLQESDGAFELPQRAE